MQRVDLESSMFWLFTLSTAILGREATVILLASSLCARLWVITLGAVNIMWTDRESTRQKESTVGELKHKENTFNQT